MSFQPTKEITKSRRQSLSTSALHQVRDISMNDPLSKVDTSKGAWIFIASSKQH